MKGLLYRIVFGIARHVAVRGDGDEHSMQRDHAQRAAVQGLGYEGQQPAPLRRSLRR